MAKPPTPVQQATAVVKAQVRPIDYLLATQAKRDKSAQDALAAAGHALIQQLQGGVAPAGHVYDQAVGQQQALAQGGASLLASLNPNAKIQADLAAINAPPEQRAQLAQQTQAQFPGQGGVLNIQEGTIPGASLIAGKAAAQQFLAGLPTIAALSQQRSAGGLAAQAAQNRQGLYSQRLAATSRIPEIALNLQSAATNRQFQADQAAASRAYESEQAAINRQFQAAQAQLGRQLTPYEKAQIAHQERADRAAAAAANSPTAGGSGLQYKTLPDGSQIIFNPNTGATVKVKGPSGPKSTAKFTPQQIQTYRGDATAIAHAARRGLPAEGTPGSASYKKQLFPITYNQAVREMEKHGIPLPIAVQALNRVYPSQYRVTRKGLKQTGIKQGLRKQ